VAHEAWFCETQEGQAMIEFKTNYTEKFINITPDNNFNYQLANQYGPWVATVSNKSDMDLLLTSPKMAEYMMERAEYLNEITSSPDDSQFNDATKRNKAELKRILGILKEAGVEVVE
jgi:hypothetical protein